MNSNPQSLAKRGASGVSDGGSTALCLFFQVPEHRNEDPTGVLHLSKQMSRGSTGMKRVGKGLLGCVSCRQGREIHPAKSRDVSRMRVVTVYI